MTLLVQFLSFVAVAGAYVAVAFWLARRANRRTVDRASDETTVPRGVESPGGSDE